MYISDRGIDYAHLITAGTPLFLDLPTALSWQEKGNVAELIEILDDFRRRWCFFPTILCHARFSHKLQTLSP